MRFGLWLVAVSALLFVVLAAPLPAPRALAEETNLVPVFSATITSLSFPEGKDVGETLLPAAEGGDGQLTYSLTGLPAGMTFDAATRALGGTPSEAGDFSMTYTATDEDGDQASFSLTVTVDPAPQTARSKTGPDAPGSLKAVRAPSATAMKPALDVTWTTPADNGFPITKYEISYGLDTDNMTKVTAVATATSVRLTDLAAGTTYTVRALAFAGNSGQHGVAGARADTTGKTNTPPTEGLVYLLDNTDSWGSLNVNDVSGYFSDGDNDTLTFEASSTRPGIASVSIHEDGAEFERYFRNPGTATATYGVRDGYGGYASRSITLTVTADVTRDVPERSPAGTNVGSPITGRQPPEPDNNQIYTYTLTGAAATYFEIDSSTGQISVKEGTTLDYETKDSYKGKVNWTVQGQAAVANLTINVTDLEAVIAGAPALTRTEFSEQSNPALDVTWTAAAANGLTITGYEAQYRVKVAEGETANAWTDYTVDDGDGEPTTTLPATTTSINLPDLTPGTTYEAQVRALTSEEGEGPWSDTGEGTANQPPAWNGVFFLDIGTLAMNSIVSIQNSLADHFTDADGDTLTYSATSEYLGIINAWVEGDRPKLHVINPAASEVTFRASDPYGGVSDTFTHTYVGSANVTRTVRENSPADTMVGDRVQGSPYNGQALTYTLTGEPADSGHFYIKPFGRIRVKEGASLDYETKSSYTGKVEYTIQGQPVAINVTINVIDVEAVIAGAPTLTRTEFSEPTDPALDVTWTAAAANGLTITGYEAQYRVKVADGETANAWTDYTVDDANGEPTTTLPATTTSINLPDLTPGTTYEAQVRALTSEEGEGPWSDTGEGTANQPPAWNGVFFLDIGTLPMNSIAHIQNSLADHFTDADGDTLTYSASSKYVGIINAWLESDRPKLHVINPAASEVTFRASDPYGGVSDTFTHTYVGSANVTRTVRENSPADTMVGDRVQGSPYNGQALTYTLTGEPADSGHFYIKPFGRIRVKEGASLDYETKSSYTGKVEYTIQGQPVAINVTINVIDVEAVIAGAPTLTRTEFSEPSDPALDVTWTAAAANGLTITGYEAQYRVKVAEGETANAWTDYTVDDGDGNPTTTLPATTTSINLPDLTAGTTYEAQVRALTSEEGEGPWSDIGSAQANQPPAAGASPLPDATVPWGTPTDYDISDKFSDGDGDTLTYSASSEYAGVLTAAITGSDGDVLRVTVNNPAASTVTYGVSDGYGGYASLSVEITGARSEARSVLENSAAGTAVGNPLTGTPHGTETLSYTLTGEASTSGAFEIDSATGQISVAEGSTLDYETKSSYSGQVSWTVKGQAAVASLTINVTDLEAGKPGTPAVTRTEFSEPTDPALDVTWTAAAANGLTITGYEAQYRVKVAEGETANAWTDYTVDDGDGNPTTTLPATTTSINLPDLTAGTTYEAQVRALTSEEGEGPWSDIGSAQANQPPTAGASPLPDATVRWGTPTDYDIGDKFSDGDGDTLTYSASSEYAGVLTAAITGSDGDVLRVTVKNPAASTVAYGVSDGYGGYASLSVEITGARSEARSVLENSQAGTAVGDPLTGTPHGTETLSYTLTGEASTSGAFEIDSATGQISVKQGATLDHDTKSSYTGKVEYTVQGQATAIDVTINVVDIGTPGMPTVTRTEFSVPTNPALDVTWTAPADGGATVTGYEAQYRKQVAEGENANAWTDYTYNRLQR